MPNSEGEAEEYFYIEDVSGLISEAQMGTLEFHIWGSRVDQLEKPDMMVFDLDPDEGMDLATVRQGVRDMRSILAELSLDSFLKTSGGKGYHVVVPLKPSVSWDAFHDFAKGVAEVMEKKWPTDIPAMCGNRKEPIKFLSTGFATPGALPAWPPTL